MVVAAVGGSHDRTFDNQPEVAGFLSDGVKEDAHRGVALNGVVQPVVAEVEELGKKLVEVGVDDVVEGYAFAGAGAELEPDDRRPGAGALGPGAAHGREEDAAEADGGGRQADVQEFPPREHGHPRFAGRSSLCSQTNRRA